MAEARGCDAVSPDLGARAVACKGWRWMAGMRLKDGDRVVSAGDPRMLSDLMGRHVPPLVLVARYDDNADACELPVDALPDFTDPATRGCVLELVRTLYRDPLLRVEGFPDGWRTVRTSLAPYILGLGPTEVAALIHALEQVALVQDAKTRAALESAP